MRRKVYIPEMAALDNQLLSDLADFEVKGREAAFSLFTINHLTLNKEDAVTEIVNQLFCFVGIVPALRNFLTATPGSPLFNREQVETLSQYFASCRSVLRKIDAAVREADEWFGPSSTQNPLEAPASFCYRSELSDGQKLLSAIFVDVVVMISVARVEHLSRPGFIANDEVFECHSLRAALKRLGYTRQLSTPNTSLEEDKLCQQQLRYASSVVNTPSSTRESTPAALDTNTPETVTATSTPALEATTSETEKESTLESSIEKSDTKVDNGNSTNQSEPTSEISSKTFLEAYILRPFCEDIYRHTEWSYTIEQLPLANTEIQAHMRKLGSDYSVIDSIGELLSEQLRLIRIRVNARQGHLLSIQYGQAVDMVTKIGHFQIKPVVFVLKTAPPTKPEPDEESKVAVQSSRNLFGNPYQIPGGFFGNPSQNGQNNNGGFFGKLAPQRILGTPDPTVNTPSWWSQPGPDIVDYVQNLKDKRELCLHMEKEHHNATGYQHYQSLPFNVPYENLSFEEIHLADLMAGRTGPSQASSNPFPTNISSFKLNGDGFISRPTVCQGFVDQSSKPAVGLFGSVRPVASGGLFGGVVKYSSPPPPLETATQNTTGFSGATSTQNNAVRPGTGFFEGFGTQTVGAPTGPGLFGGARTQGTIEGVFNGFGASSTADASGSGLFGGPRALNSNPPSTSLFGSTQPTTTGSLFGTSGAPNPIPTSTSMFNTTQPVPTGGLFGSSGAVNCAPPVTNLFNNTQPPPPTGGLFGPTSSANSLPIRPSPFGSAAALPNNPRPTNPFTGFQNSIRPGPSTDTTQSNERPFGAPGPFSYATATFRPAFGTTSALNPPASTIHPPRSAFAQQGEVQTTRIDKAEPRSDGSEGGVSLRDAKNV